MHSPNILHIVSGNLNGGAARGAYWLHQGLLEKGINSKILINSPLAIRTSSITSIVTSPKDKFYNALRFQLEQLPVKRYKSKQNIHFSTALFGYDITQHPLYEWADIIHLHWINGGFMKLKSFHKIHKPIVWTLRDMWPLTGGCHYSLGCEKYKTGCGTCPVLGSNRYNDLSRKTIKRKQKAYSPNMKLIGISNWLSEKAKESLVFQNYDIETIYNNVNCTDFFPVKKQTAREMLGVNTTAKIVLVGAQNLKDSYKGFDKFLQAIKLLNPEKIYLAFFGKLDEQTIKSLNFKFVNFGFLNDTISMRLAYSCADVFVAPSLEEAFGKTIVESMACGTPVACFDATGPKDIVDHKINGYKAKPFDIVDLKNGIEWIIQHADYYSLAQQARMKVEKQFDSKVIAAQYIKLYSSLLMQNTVDNRHQTNEPIFDQKNA